MCLPAGASLSSDSTVAYDIDNYRIAPAKNFSRLNAYVTPYGHVLAYTNDGSSVQDAAHGIPFEDEQRLRLYRIH